MRTAPPTPPAEFTLNFTPYYFTGPPDLVTIIWHDTESSDTGGLHTHPQSEWRRWWPQRELERHGTLSNPCRAVIPCRPPCAVG